MQRLGGVGVGSTVLVLDREEGLEMFRIEVAAQRRPIGAKTRLH